MSGSSIAGIGQRIRARRDALGKTQNALARSLDISFQAVSKWERGESLPDLALLPRLAAVLQVSIDWLLGATVNESTRRAPALKGLRESEILNLLNYCELRNYQEGECVYGMADQPHLQLYLVESGQFQMRKFSTQREIARPGPGEFFSDYSFFDGLDCITSAYALQAGRVYVVDISSFNRFKAEHPDDALQIYHNEILKAVAYFREFE